MFIKADTPLQAFHEVVAMLEAENTVLKKKAEDQIPLPMKVGKWPSASDFKWNNGYNNNCSLNKNGSYWFTFHNYYSKVEVADLTIQQLDGRRKLISDKIDELEVAIEAAAQESEGALENNKLIHEKVKLMMKHIGIPDSYSTWEYKTNRSSKKTETRHQAGYIGDLVRNVPIALEGVKPDVKSLRSTLDRHYEEIKRQVMVAENEREKKKKETENQHKIALLRAKFCPYNHLADKWEIQQAILEKDKYLRLAYWLERNRDDWSNGYDYADTGLSGFVVETELDQKIYDCINEILTEEDEYYDGRVFRDCEYDYGTLYGMVEDAELLKAIQQYKELFNGY